MTQPSSAGEPILGGRAGGESGALANTEARGSRRERQRSEWRAGWPVVLAAMMGGGVGGVSVHSMGLFIAPLEAELGWSRAQITSGLTIWSALVVLFAPFVGILIDRYGPRPFGIAGVVVFCVLFGALGLVGSSIVGWWLMWSAIAFGSACIKPPTWTAAVASRFQVGRGLALAGTLCGPSVSSILTPPIAALLIPEWGWRGAYMGVAAFWLMISLPLIVAFFRDAHDISPDQAIRQTKRAAVRDGLEWRAGLRSRPFWLILPAVFIYTLLVSAMSVHFVPILTGNGLASTTAAGIASIVGISSVVGRLTTGALIDRVGGARIGAVVFLVPALPCALLLTGGHSIGAAIGIAILFGLALGAELDVATYLAAQYFGLKNFGVLYGTIVGFTVLAAGVGPLAAAYIFDTNASYTLFLQLTIPLFAMSSVLIGALGKRPPGAAPVLH